MKHEFGVNHIIYFHKHFYIHSLNKQKEEYEQKLLNMKGEISNSKIICFIDIIKITIGNQYISSFVKVHVFTRLYTLLH